MRASLVFYSLVTLATVALVSQQFLRVNPPTFVAGGNPLYARCQHVACFIGADAAPPLNDSALPPCALLIRDVLRAVQGVFAAQGVGYVAQSGTVLGALRSNGIIAWTSDADLAIEAATTGAALRNPVSVLRQALAAEQLDVFDERGVWRVCGAAAFVYHATPRQASAGFRIPNVDLYSWHPVGSDGKHVRVHGQPCGPIPVALLWPTRNLTIYDLQVPGPALPTAYLVRIYGANYMEPPPPNKRKPYGSPTHRCDRNWRELSNYTTE